MTHERIEDDPDYPDAWTQPDAGAGCYQAPRAGWVCFHCGRGFADTPRGQELAVLHFGSTVYTKPACQYDTNELREMEAELRRYREEDTDLHRAIHAARSEGVRRAKRAEEDGYAKGLAVSQAAVNACLDVFGITREAATLGTIDTKRVHDIVDAAMRAKPEKPQPKSAVDEFCDSHCCWLEHHPSCPRHSMSTRVMATLSIPHDGTGAPA